MAERSQLNASPLKRMVQSAALDELTNSLDALVAALARDPNSEWSAAFEALLVRALSLGHSTASASELKALARDVLACYRGGMGSFNDYAPVRYDPATRSWQTIPGLERERELAGLVHDQALSLLAFVSDASL